jgi:predicted XRE-type DNA-binding protein
MLTTGQVMSKRRKADVAFEKSSGNIFAQLGFPHPEQELVRARLALQIHRIIKARKLTQMQAAKVLGIQQPSVSRLLNGRSGEYAVERLMDFLTALGQDVQITVRPTRKEHGHLSVVVA